MTEGQRSGRERSDEERRRRKEWRVMGKGVMEKGRGGEGIKGVGRDGERRRRRKRVGKVE